MDEVARLLLLLMLAGVTLTLLGALAIHVMEEDRRIRRGLKKVLKATPHALLIAPDQGRAIGFNFNSDLLAVAWDSGAWCLIYGVEELVGAELLVDGQLAARAYRGEARRPVSDRGGPENEVRLRFIFDDARYPDFDLVLWLRTTAGRRKSLSSSEAVHEANSWISRTEALLRRPTARLPQTIVAARPMEAVPAAVAGPPTPPWSDEGEDDFSAWQEDEDAA